MTVAPSLPLDLDAPLPDELAGRHHGWFTRYRRYPVFSAPWARGRLKSVGLLTVLGYVALLAPAALMSKDPAMPLPWGGAAQFAIGLLLPVWAGPWLGSHIRRRGWEPGREWAALVVLMAALVVGLLAFHEWGAEPVKQWIAERTGNVDANGKRKRVVMSLGLSVSQPDGRQDKSLHEIDQRLGLADRIGNDVTLALLTFWLAGGAGLWAWRRERTGLRALARERELAQAQAQRREAELRLSVLAAQVEPHFLFNTLAGVRSAISTDPARASDMIDRLVDYLRAAIPRLRRDGQVQATLGAQLDIVRAYLGLMAARMPRLQFSVQAPPELLAARCPPLMLISLAENAVKHGVERKVGPARVQVLAERDEQGRLSVTVADDGPGFQPTGSGTGIGLANIRERLAQLYPDSASLQLRARPEGGVAATLTLPLHIDTKA